VAYVTKHLWGKVPLNAMQEPMVEKSRTLAVYVTKLLNIRLVCEITQEAILGKGLKNAICATKHF